jgi:hypothetical protein
MKKRKSLQANSLDVMSTHLLADQKVGVVSRVFKEVVTVDFAQTERVHFVLDKVGNGPRRVVLDASISAFEEIEVGQPVSVTAIHTVELDSQVIDAREATLWEQGQWQEINIPKAVLLTYLTKRSLNLKILNIDPFIHEQSLVQQTIQQFIDAPTENNLEQIIGLGSGSTPLGDDALLGWILANHMLGIKLDNLAKQILPILKKATTPLSAEVLKDALDKNYSEVFIRWFQGLIALNTTTADETILGLGGNSGAMILTSFYQTMLKKIKEASYANISTYTYQ